MQTTGRRSFGLALLLVLAAVVGIALSAAAADDRRPASAVAIEWQRSLDAVERALAGRRPGEDQAERQRRVLATIIAEARAVEEQARGDIEAGSRLIEALGPPPGDGEAAETPEVARQRKEFNDTLALHRSRLAQAEVTVARAQGLQADVAAATRERFLAYLATRLPAPLAHPQAAAAALAAAAAKTGDGVAALAAAVGAIIAGDAADPAAASPLLILAAAALLGWSGRRLLWRWLGPLADPPPPAPPPTATRRLLVASGLTLAALVLPAALIGGMALIVEQLGDALGQPWRRLAVAGWLALLAVAAAFAIARTLAAGACGRWRLTPLAAAATRRLAWRGFWVVALVALDALVVRVPPPPAPPSPELIAWATLLFAGLAAVAVVRFVADSAWVGADPPQPAAAAAAVTGHAAAADGDAVAPPWRWGTTFGRVARVLVVGLAIAAVVAALFGFSNLGHYLARNVLLLITAFVAAVIVRAFAREAVMRGLHAVLARAGDADDALRATQDRFWLSLLLDPLLVLAAAWLLAPAWRLPRHDLLIWVHSLAEGVRVGGITISPVDALLAVATFGLALAVTRAVRNSLADRILPHTRLDRGVRHSIAVGVGYVGVSLSALLAIAVLGIDLSSLALVAGALSVGIGFGLQNIVSNFISGLILLIERPVKVGDFVMIGDKQGFVRRIKVRSTELETFERSTIIVPNSDLLSQTVTNWTHKDTIGRVDVRVGVAYGSAPERVEAILLGCAQGHPDITRQPAPFVLFQDFGDNALLFELRAFVFDVSKRLRVGSDLRLAIDRAFREAGVEIPCAQREVWLTHVGEAPGAGAPGAAPPGAAPPGAAPPGRGAMGG